MKRVTWLLALSIAAAMLLLAACDRMPRAAPSATGTARTAEGSPAVPTPRSTAGASATAPAVLVPMPTKVASPAALFVVVRGRELWVVSVRTPGLTRRLVNGPTRAEYGGRSQSGRLFYSIRETGADDEVGRFAVYSDLAYAARPQRLFDFEGRSGWASPSADGTNIAFVSVRGLETRDLATGRSEVRVPAGAASCAQPGPGCFRDDLPKWPVDGRFLAFFRTYYEDFDSFVLDLATPGAAPTSVGKIRGASEQDRWLIAGGWSPESARLCALTRADFGKRDLFTVDPSTRTRVLMPLPYAADSGATEESAAGCEWSRSGMLASIYWRNQSHDPLPGSTAVVFLSGTETPRLVPVPDAPSPQFVWLPDESGLVYGTKGQWIVVERSGSLARVDLDADAILDILPE